MRTPIIVSKRSGLIVAGHGRYLAAKQAGMKKVPVSFQDFASEAQEYAFGIADNGTAQWAELDITSIGLDMQSFPELELEMLGLQDFELPGEDQHANKDADDIPTIDKIEAKCKRGQIWQLGTHRLMCGDSTNHTEVSELMDGEKACITFTSPPYNLGNNAVLRGKNAAGEKSAYRTKSDHKSTDEYLNFLKTTTDISLRFSDIAFWNVQCLAGNKTVIPEYWYHFRDRLVDILIWDKEHAAPAMGKNVLNSVFEFVFAFTGSENTTRSIDTGKSFRGTLENIYRLNPVGKKDPLAKDHRAVFPVAFAEHFVANFSKKSVLELFGGSGSTIIACEKNHRNCYTMELDPHYLDLIIARWEQFSEQEAIEL